MSILIGADIVPTQSNSDLFKAGDIESLIGSGLVECLNKSDYRIFNIEAPITDIHEPIPKCGLNLQIPSACIKGLSAMRIDLVTLANNHILDQGEKGLFDIQRHLDEAGINHIGTGINIYDARKPHIFMFSEKRVGVYACTEHEFSVATEETAGANPFDPLESPDDVSLLKQDCDYVIVLYHGGKEHYRYPSPLLQRVCRRFVDKGADLVICQHSHCIGCEEKYRDRTIVYGQGNFLFDYSDDECWQTSLLIKIEDDFSVSYLPLVKVGNGVRLADEKNRTEIMRKFNSRSDDIKKPGFVKKQYSQFADTYLEFYLRALSGEKSLLFRVINKLSRGHFMKRYLQRCYSKAIKVRIANYIDCEAHRELLSQAIENDYKGVKQ